MRANVSRLVFGSAVFLIAGIVAAQTYPSRPVRMVIPAAAGAPDAVGRILAQQLQLQFGQPVVVENRPGANTVTGTDLVAKAEPDGHTLLMVSTAIAINPSLRRTLPYDTARDLDPVTLVASGPGYILTVNAGLPVKSVKDLVALASQPGSTLSYGSPGVGNALHLVAELFKARTGANIAHVAYRGAGPAIADLLGGHIQVMFVTPPLSMPHIRAGKLRPLAFAGAQRWSVLPDVPVMAEAGVNGVVLDGGWYGLFAPAKTSISIRDRLHAEVTKALAVKDVHDRYTKLSLDVVGDGPAAFRAIMAESIERYRAIVHASKIEPQ